MGTSVTLSSTMIGSISMVCKCAKCYSHLAAVHLGLAARFAILATNTVTDTMTSYINGDMGTSTGVTQPVYATYNPSSTDRVPGRVASWDAPAIGLKGTQHRNDATAIAVRAAAIAAWIDIKSRTLCARPKGGVAELGGQTLTPGLYTSTSSFHSECIRALQLADLHL